ncbi:MAG TPA: transcription-repair coupling factor [Ignavibacteria bacterium]|nr:transcription-repair coupling factor [Ignavibacteria bacterium]
MKDLKKKIFHSSQFQSLKSFKERESYCLTGVNGSLTSFILEYISQNVNPKVFLISSEKDRINNLKDDLDTISSSENVSIIQTGEPDDEEQISKSLTLLSEDDSFIIICNSKELSKKFIAKDKFVVSIIELGKEKDFPFNDLIAKLSAFHYTRKDFVEEVGDFSVRGGIIDIYPESLSTPVRVEFFGDTVESIREFDITTQRSLKEISSVKFGMNLSTQTDEDENYKPDSSIFEYISNDTLIVLDNPEVTLAEVEDLSFMDMHQICLITQFENLNVLESQNLLPTGQNFILENFSSKPQPDFHSNLRHFYSNICNYQRDGYDVYILSSDEVQAERFESLLEDFKDEEIFNRDTQIHSVNFDEDNEEDNYKKESSASLDISRVKFLSDSLHEGFIFNDANTVVYTEHQVFGRYFRQFKKRKHKFKGLTFNELKELTYGDYIVHRDFGIGKFEGLKKIKVGSNEQEAVKLTYDAGDTVFVNLNYIHLIKKYSSTEGYVPKLTSLGGGEWDKLKLRAKKKVQDIARDLILLYAKRKSEQGFSFSQDTHWQRELEANFMYEDTPDQYKATVDVKNDMQSQSPMDRLVCGDVGFGKTEVAVRAAFKAVLDNKQVAVLVPTTILAVQHYNTFRDRLSPFAVEVAVLTRFQTKKEQKEILEKLAEGKINIIIGTHRILSKDIQFKDIGLLIIDEEQRFGVKAKEKIRSIQPNIDTLTLTATPIPRTMNFSLLGARDLSIINTPPKNRKPIHTEIIKMDWDKLHEIMSYELKRGGQIYFVNDTIERLYTLADKIRHEIPHAKPSIAHGQMEAHQLEDAVINFIEKKTNVLVCTKIIESGLDIPNVNTIIINNADRYGLSELYQLRGRVGRSETQAFAYLISSGKLTKTAIKRLQAIEEFTELGSGINLSMRDMEIRGVGNLLGKEQSGFVQQIGFELFMSIIDEAVSELKENEFSELFREFGDKDKAIEQDEKKDETQKLGKKIEKKPSLVTIKRDPTVIENDLNALIPKDYIENDTERLNIYRKLYEASFEEELKEIRAELIDRFGEFLEDVENLFELVRLKIKATNLGLEKISIQDNLISLYFPKDKEHPIFQGEYFTNLIDRISKDNTKKFNISGAKDQLIIEKETNSVKDIDRLKELDNILN